VRVASWSWMMYSSGKSESYDAIEASSSSSFSESLPSSLDSADVTAAFSSSSGVVALLWLSSELEVLQGSGIREGRLAAI